MDVLFVKIQKIIEGIILEPFSLSDRRFIKGKNIFTKNVNIFNNFYENLGVDLHMFIYYLKYKN